MLRVPLANRAASGGVTFRPLARRATSACSLAVDRKSAIRAAAGAALAAAVAAAVAALPLVVAGLRRLLLPLLVAVALAEVEDAVRPTAADVL